jgi:hypothetical protein
MRYCGEIGFSISQMVAPGVYEDNITTERTYFGDVTVDNRKNLRSDKVVEDVSISNVFSVVSDPFAFENLNFIRYIKYMGIAWKVESVEVQYPRLIIRVGGEWNGPVREQPTQAADNA